MYVLLPALPDDSQLTSHTFFAEVGTTALLDCAITPGSLVEQYFVTWENGTSGLFYNQIPPISSTTATPFNPRYFIEPTNFSLLISNVQLSDSDSTYRCFVGVQDPLFGNRISFYTNTENTNLRLVVYCEFTSLATPSLHTILFPAVPPVITEPPIDVTLSMADTPEACFTCTAVGDPVPEISWRHNGEKTTSVRYHVTQSSPMADPESGGVMRMGNLGIFSLIVEDSGSVECVASVVVSGDTTGGERVSSDKETVQLAVLGE